jgi:hypothetical protein
MEDIKSINIKDLTSFLSKDLNIEYAEIEESLDKFLKNPKKEKGSIGTSSGSKGTSKKTPDELIKTIKDAKKEDKYHNVSTGRKVGKTSTSQKTYLFFDEYNICGKKDSNELLEALKYLKSINFSIEVKTSEPKKVLRVNKFGEEASLKLVYNKDKKLFVGVYTDPKKTNLRGLNKDEIEYCKKMGYKYQTDAEDLEKTLDELSE